MAFYYLLAAGLLSLGFMGVFLKRDLFSMAFSISIIFGGVILVSALFSQALGLVGLLVFVMFIQIFLITQAVFGMILFYNTFLKLKSTHVEEIQIALTK